MKAERPERAPVFTKAFRADLRYYVETNRPLALRLLDLVEAVLRDPFAGIGKPEPLKYLGPNIWSRRVTRTDRMVYRVLDQQVHFLQGRYHYE